MKKPWVGLTAARIEHDTSSHLRLSEKYNHIVLQAGGFPLVFPCFQLDDDFRNVLQHLDGLVLTGGGDIQTTLFSGTESDTVSDVDELRDRMELELVRFAVDEGIPFLGICRGIQVINVALGGTLYTDLKESGFEYICHERDTDKPTDHLAHSIDIVLGSRLSAMISENNCMVNSSHHQGIDILAPVLEAAAYAPDGLVEAVELKHHPFGMGVQWHPECIPDSEITGALMEAFIKAAGIRATGKSSSTVAGM